MSNLFHIRSLWPAILITGLALTGCAGLTTVDIQPVTSGVAGQSESPPEWWFVRIQWHWAEDMAPAWHLDLLAAHQILLPLINAHGDEILLWRIHRRAGRDEAGHQFSLLFYASGQTAQTIYSGIADNAVLADLTAAGMVAQVKTRPLTDGSFPNIEDMSDPAWSPAMQASWPHYIHGVSRMWLDLVSITANPLITDSAPVTLDGTVALYRQVDADINDVWQTEGSHALLHHLNAIFGYQPVPVRF